MDPRMGSGFTLRYLPHAEANLEELEAAAAKAEASRRRTGKSKSSRQEGLYDQVAKCLALLQSNPRHPGLHAHEFASIEHPFKEGDKVFEAYAQNQTPSAYRVFWCYGPDKGEITILKIAPHP